MYDRYSCNSGLAKTKIFTFALKIINSKSVFNTTFTRGEFIRVNVETVKNFSVFACCSSNEKELIWIKTNTKKRVDKVLPCKIFILISLRKKLLLM